MNQETAGGGPLGDRRIHAALEAEHEALETLLCVLRDSVLAGASSTKIIQMIDMAIDFSTAHFKHEEAFFRAHGYHDLEGHAVAHERLHDSFKRIRDVAVGEGVCLATLDTVDLLHDFLEHIAQYDAPAYEQINHARASRTGVTGVSVESAS